MASTDKVTCAICGFRAHFLEKHISEEHRMMSAQYQAAHPGAPLVFEAGTADLRRIESEGRREAQTFNIRSTFGIDAFKGINECIGFKKRTRLVPDIIEGYAFRKPELKAVLYCLSKNIPMLLTGPTGSGKTSLYEQVAARLNWPFSRFNCDADNTRSDLVGCETLKGKETVFRYGVLPTTMREGHILVIDEWDCMPPSIAMVLQSVWEGKDLFLSETNEVIKPHKDFRIVGTSNTVGLGDETGLYAGTSQQNYAQLDRFKLVAEVDYPGVPEERRILNKLLPELHEEHVTKLLNVAKDVRTAFKRGDIMVTQSTRTVINLAELMIDFGDVKFAYEMGWLNKMTQSDRGVVTEMIQRIWGSEAA